MRLAHYFGASGSSNCFFFVVQLWLRGRVVRIVRLKGGHWTAQTRHGTWVHFRSPMGKKSLWFSGRPHALKRKRSEARGLAEGGFQHA